MIRGKCETHLDDYKVKKWPEQFVAVPMLGDTVQAKTGECLTVVGVTHLMYSSMAFSVHGGKKEGTEYPFIIIELSKYYVI